MKIFLKYIIKSMSEKKSRLFLLILAIAMSAGLLVSIVGAVQVAINSFGKPMLEQFEGKEIVINTKEYEAFFDISEINNQGVKNIQGELVLSGIIQGEDETTKANMYGKENENINEDYLVDGNLNDFTGAKCIISKRISTEKNLQIGDELEVIIGGEVKKIEICAINSSEGVFYGDTKTSFGVVVPYKYLAEEFKVQGKYNYVIANKNNDVLQDSINEFNDNNTKYEASELYNESAVKSQMNSITMVLYIMLLIVVVMSSIIIYGSFKLTITERLSIIGTFLSQGATKRTIEKILYLESIAYGIIGGIFGVGIGIIGLALINYFTSPLKDYGIIEKLYINPIYLIIGLVFAVVLSFVSALVPIKKIRKLEVKDVILNNVNISMSIGWGKFIVGIIIIIISIGLNYIDTEWANALSGVFIIISIIGVILIYPKLIDIVTSILFKVFRGKSKVVVFALNNLRTSKVLLGNITLIVISMLAILMITSIGSSMKSMVSDAYVKLELDVAVGNIRGINGLDGITVTDRIIEKMKENKNVNKDSIQYSIGAMGDLNGEMGIVEGINSEKYRDYNGYLELNDSKYEKMFNDFNKSDNNEVIIGTKLKKKLKLETGDTVTIKVNDIKKEFNVAGSIDEKLYNNGMVIFIKNEVIKREFNIKEANQIIALGNINQEELKDELMPILKEFGATAKTKAEIEKENMDTNQVIMNVLGIFSYLAIFIASLGVLNNIMIGFLQRKRELAVLSSVGMSRGNRNLMLITESVLCVVWSILIAIPYSYLGVSLLNKALIPIDMPLNIKVDINAVPVYFVASLVLILLATVPIVIKSKKLSIIDELKYE